MWMHSHSIAEGLVGVNSTQVLHIAVSYGNVFFYENRIQI